ncbi:MAG: phage holin family protein [Actinomycetota bacterium]|nr:phage holin family protein [Actinomycetota bacterium]
MRFLSRLIIVALAILAVSYFLPGIKIEGGMTVDGFLLALLVALVLAVVNAVIRPILAFFAFPVTIITFGLFNFVINAFMLILVSRVIQGFAIDNFISALIGSFLISLANVIASGGGD